jgi:hypothetical protein
MGVLLLTSWFMVFLLLLEWLRLLSLYCPASRTRRWRIRRAGELSTPRLSCGVSLTLILLILMKASNGRTVRIVMLAFNGILRRDRFLLLHVL